MKLIVTCGPSYEPIDGARRMTNMSTGKLGVILSNHFTAAGHEVICLKGEGSTYAGPVRASRLETFATNDDLIALLERLRLERGVDALFHAAALCDYRVEAVRTEHGETLQSRKFATRDGRLHIVMAPATKVLPRLREWFPDSRIVGWKYELAGTREDAFARAWRQVHDGHTDATVLNGSAYGDGFAVCQHEGTVEHCRDLTALCQSLTRWTENVDMSRGQPAPLAAV